MSETLCEKILSTTWGLRVKADDFITKAKVVLWFCCLVAVMLPLAGCGLSPADQAKADAMLFQAVICNKVEDAKDWLRRGANVNATEWDDSTPLHWSASAGYKVVAEFLIEKGANVNATNKLGLTPLHNAASKYKSVAVAELLIEKGANVNATSKKGETPLQLALYWGHKGVAELLRKHGAK